MTPREARIDDAPELAHLATELGYASTPEQMAARLRAREMAHEAWLVADDAAGRAIGFVHVARARSPIEGSAALVAALVVGSGHRRGGLGRRLMEAAERWARAQGLGRVRLASRTTRLPAHAFYRSLGYGEVKTQLVFEKELDPGPGPESR